MITIEELNTRYTEALSDRRAWENLWRECYDYALPNQATLAGKRDGGRRTDQIFDATAMDGVDGLATALLGQVTPPWMNWFTLKGGTSLTSSESKKAVPRFEAINQKIASHINHANFTVEIHQCYLELVTAGTACIAVHEAPIGNLSALRFEAIPLSDIVLEEGSDGRLSNVFRPMKLTRGQVKQRYPDYITRGDDAEEMTIIDAVLNDNTTTMRIVFIPDDGGTILEIAPMRASPYIVFRWQKAAGERYGRSPVMKALPDIKTANKVVELILKNASIAVTGIWQADDDGVLNPANIILEPGAIIPKAVGSQGLKPLEMPSRFDVSQLVLDDLRKHIRSALMIDRLVSSNAKSMTATEVMERSSENALLLAATYGRLQAELLMPLLDRIMAVLMARGEIPTFDVDGDRIALDMKSPIAAIQIQKNVQAMLSWLDAATKLGPEAMAVINKPRAIIQIAAELGVSSDLIQDFSTTTTTTTIEGVL